MGGFTYTTAMPEGAKKIAVGIINAWEEKYGRREAPLTVQQLAELPMADLHAHLGSTMPRSAFYKEGNDYPADDFQRLPHPLKGRAQCAEVEVGKSIQVDSELADSFTSE